MISRIVQEVCNDLKIPYKSPHILKNDDINTIVEIYEEINSIARKLTWIEHGHHKIVNFKTKMDKTITELETIKNELIEEYNMIYKEMEG